MKQIAIAALALAVAIAPATAQDSGLSGTTGAGPGEGVGLDQPSGDVNTNSTPHAGAGEGIGTGPATPSATTSQFATSMEAGSFSSATQAIANHAPPDLSGITDAAQVRIIRLSSLDGDASTEAAALDEAIAGRRDNMGSLHEAVSANEAVTGALDTEGVAVEDVVAVSTDAERNVLVYVDDR